MQKVINYINQVGSDEFLEDTESLYYVARCNKQRTIYVKKDENVFFNIAQSRWI